MQVVIITGLSGAGRTKAVTWFEDEGYYCIDNMPPKLVRNFVDLSLNGNGKIEKAAFVIDIRGGEFFSDVKELISVLSSDENVDLKILYVEASDEVLIRRYNESRRTHPITNEPITEEAIEQERRALSDIRKCADYIIDTSQIKVSEFNQELEQLFIDDDKKESFVLKVMSFGFKNGVPLECDMITDVRFIPNPYYVPSLKKLTGNNKKVSQYVLRQEITKEFVKGYTELLEKMIPAYIKEGKYSLTVCFGCTGGHHRSVVVANEIAQIFKNKGLRVSLEHRDL